MPGCCGYGCSNRRESGKILFAIPEGKNDRQRRALWIHRIGRKNFVPTRSTRLCEDHFTEDQFEKVRVDGKKKLKWNAVPSIFMHRKQAKPRKAPFPRQPVSLSPLTSSREFGMTQTEADCANEDRQGEDDDTENVPMVLAENQEVNHPNVGTEGTVNEVLPSLPTVTANLPRVDTVKLLERIAILERQLNLEQKRRRKAESQSDRLKQSLGRIFVDDQLFFLERGTMRGSAWSHKTIQEALKLRLSCGSRGYNYLREIGWPLPAERTLQKHIEDIKFSPGILDEVFCALATKVATFPPHERYAALTLDEIQLSQGLDYDNTTHSVIGQPTIPASDPNMNRTLATHALVFMLGGITARWKQTVAYHFSAESFDAQTVKEIIFEVIRRSESIGLTIDCVTSDMGAGNQAIWRLCGILATKYGRPSTTCPHPCGSGRVLHFMADAPHLLKNLRGHLVRQQLILLDANTVERNSLPTNEVSIRYVEQLCKLDEQHDLKLAPHLKLKHLSPAHYEKMNVGPAYAIFNHSVAAGVRLLVAQKMLDSKALTTAWFLDQVFKWFSLMTSRSPTMALSNLCPEKGKMAVAFLHELLDWFTTMQIIDRGRSHASWKPVQAGVVITTTTALNLRNHYVEKEGLKFLMLSRFTQDALENLFSTIRLKSPIPRAREFKSALRLITLAQFFKPSQHGSYDIDDSAHLADFLNARPDITHTNEDDVVPGEIINLVPEERESLVYLCGYVVRNVMNKSTLCDKCKAGLTDEENEDGTEFLALKNYVPGQRSLHVPSKPVVCLLECAECYFRKNELCLVQSSMKIEDLVNAIKKQDVSNHFEQCHGVAEKLVHEFLLCRLRFALRKVNEKLLSKFREQARCGSKSVGMRAAVSNIK